jgi:hypothetical protein
VGLVAAALGVAFLVHKGPSTARAADHLDAPSLTPPPGGDGIGTDLTDIYAFRSPADTNKTVLVMNVNGLTTADLANPPGPNRPFATKVPEVQGNSNVSYNFRIDSNGDAVADRTIRVQFNKPDADGAQHMRVALLDAAGNEQLEFAGSSTGFGKNAVVNTGPSGIRFFAGRRDDPFFFDLVGFLNLFDLGGKSFVGCTGSHPENNTFKKQNVSSIVIELPSSMLEGGGAANIGVWATTNVGEQQIDRMGRPAINTVFLPNNPIPPDTAAGGKQSAKTSFNHATPQDDVNPAFVVKNGETIRQEVVDTLQTLFSLNDPASNLGGTDDPSDDAGKINALANFLLPDILTVDVSSSAGFPNGRQLNDDVIDTELGLITEGFVTKDCVPSDNSILGTFPYVGNPN